MGEEGGAHIPNGQAYGTPENGNKGRMWKEQKRACKSNQMNGKRALPQDREEGVDEGLRQAADVVDVESKDRCSKASQHSLLPLPQASECLEQVTLAAAGV